MVDLLRNELDELMGKDRNLPLKERMKRKEHYDDPDICKYALVSVCPHDLFPNTKCDLGKCMKRHDEVFKKMFDRDESRIPFEKKYLNETIGLFESLVSDIDSKIKRAQAKLDTPIPENDRPKEVQEKLEKYDSDIKRMLQEVEKLGEEGKIDESENLDTEIQALKKKKDELLKMGDNLLYGLKQMKVCEICGAMQAINDTEKRTQIHLEGKLHTGFAVLRKELDKLRKRKEEVKNLVHYAPKEKKKSASKESKKTEKKAKRSRSRSKSNKHRKHKERSKSRSHHRSKKHRKSESRSESRSKDRKHKKDHKKKNKENKDKSKSRSKGVSESNLVNQANNGNLQDFNSNNNNHNMMDIPMPIIEEKPLEEMNINKE